MKSIRAVPLFKLAFLLLAGVAPAAVGFSAVVELGQQARQVDPQSQKRMTASTAAAPDGVQRPILTARADQLLTTEYRDAPAATRPDTPSGERVKDGQARQPLAGTQGSHEPGIWSAIASTLALALFFLLRRAG